MPPRRNIGSLDDILESYSNEDNPTNAQTARVVAVMATELRHLKDDVEEMRLDRKEENSTRIQIQEVKRGTFEYIQFVCIAILTLGSLVTSIVEVFKK